MIRAVRSADRSVSVSPEGQLSKLESVGPIPGQTASSRTLAEMLPSHPALNGHGPVRLKLLLNGEKIERVDVEPGYTHKGIEKSCEFSLWSNIFPYTNRLSSSAPYIHSCAYASAVEVLGQIVIPERAKYCRTVVAEVGRIAEHLTCLSSCMMAIGASTVMRYYLSGRSRFCQALAELSSNGLTDSYIKIGGVKSDLLPRFKECLSEGFEELDKVLLTVEKMVNKNRFFRKRMDGIGVMSSSDAISWGWTGPCLRSTGVGYDVRRAAPYDVYERVEFEVPVGTKGDNYDRYMVRMEEIRQSRRIIEQCLSQISETAPDVMIHDFRLTPPSCESSEPMELRDMIRHFKLITEGISIPEGEVYLEQEAANGELGFYIVSDGSNRPYRLHIRSPSWSMASSLGELLVGANISDVSGIYESLHIGSGDCDR